MNADHHFVIGQSHAICQDYADSSEGMAALSDGCSCVIGPDGKQITASHVDIGARLLVCAAMNTMREDDKQDSHKLCEWSVCKAISYRALLGLSQDCLSATLLTIQSSDSIAAMLCGDGVIASRSKAGVWQSLAYRFDGPPYYPIHLRRGIPPVVVREESFLAQREPNIRYRRSPVALCFDPVEIDLVIGISDGAFSFTKHGQSIPFDYDLAGRLLDFRRLKGRFIQRHLTGVLRELAQDGIVNQDDISMIGVHVE